jgi:GTP-binding protein
MDIVEAQFITTAMNVATLPPPLFAEVAFAGRSNVGKSSLINSLAQRAKLARTSSTPGCTRGLNLFRLTLRGGACIDFVDLPGYGFAQRSKTERSSWGPMIEGFLEQRVGLRGIVLLVDVRRGLQAEEHQLLEYVAHIKKEPLLVATKTDTLPLNKRKTALLTMAKESGVKVLPYSVEGNEGRDGLWRALCQLSGIAEPIKSKTKVKSQS